MTYHQFEGDAAQIKLRQRALVARLHRAVVDEHDAALLQRAHRRRHVRCAQAEPHQAFVPLDVVGAWRRLDQLEIELVAGALEQRALRQHAEILAARQHREAEQMPVEVHPVARALAQDGLHHAEVMQARERARPRLSARQGNEIDVVDGEIAVAVDEVDQAVADAVDAGDVELHRRGARRHVPGAKVERMLVRKGGVAHAKSHRRYRRHGAGRAVRVDDQVHRALPVEHHLARAVARERHEAHALQQVAEGLRLAGGVFDELDAVHSQRIGRLGRRAQGGRSPRQRLPDLAPAAAGQENLSGARPPADAVRHVAGVLRRPGAGAHQPRCGSTGDRGFDGLRLWHGRGVRGVRGGAAAARSVAHPDRAARGGRPGDDQGNRGEALTIAVFLGSLLGAMALGIPIAYALLVSGMALMWHLNVFDAQILAQNLIEGANSFTLLAVPFFLLAGEIMNVGGLSKRIVNVALAVVGHVRGGLGYVAIIAACLLASLSGSAVADAAALTALLLPMMVRAGHDKARSAGLLAAGGIIAPIIPPSIGFVIFGVAANVSITRLFLAGIVPGLLIGASLWATWWWLSRREQIAVPGRKSLAEMLKALRESAWAMVLPLIILVGLRFGVFTPTEAAVVAAVYALFVAAVVYREMKLSQIFGVLVSAAKITSIIMFLVAAALVSSWLITVAQIPQQMIALLQPFMGSQMLLMIVIMLLVMAVGTAM